LPKNFFLKQVIEGKIHGMERRGRRHKQLLNDLEEMIIYWKFKNEALYRTLVETVSHKAVDFL
jgi:hypothetical protein